MNIFSKERLFKIVNTAKRHVVLFLPVLLIIALGYIIFSLIDTLHILLLKLCNMFIAIFCFFRKGVCCIGRFFGRFFYGIGNKTVLAGHSALVKYREMRDNARTARDQLLNGAVNYCADRHTRRADKKALLRERARTMLAESKKKPEHEAAPEILPNNEGAAVTVIPKAAV